MRKLHKILQLCQMRNRVHCTLLTKKSRGRRTKKGHWTGYLTEACSSSALLRLHKKSFRVKFEIVFLLVVLMSLVVGVLFVVEFVLGVPVVVRFVVVDEAVSVVVMVVLKLSPSMASLGSIQEQHQYK